MTLHTRHVLAKLTFAGLGADLGRSTTPAPSQLVTARETYARCSAGPTARLSLAVLVEGKRMLDLANAEFMERGDTLAVRVYASIAGRTLELADALTRKEPDPQG